MVRQMDEMAGRWALGNLPGLPRAVIALAGPSSYLLPLSKPGWRALIQCNPRKA